MAHPLIHVLSLLALATSALAGSRDWKVEVKTKEDAVELAKRTFAHGPRRFLQENEFSDWWTDYKQYFNKKYASADEERKAYVNFRLSMERVASVNSDPTVPYWLSGNLFSDQSFEELQESILNGLDVSAVAPLTNDSTVVTRQGGQPVQVGRHNGWEAVNEGDRTASGRRSLLQDSVDWRDRGKVTSIKYQGGTCGACWAFASAAAIESAYLISQGESYPSSRVDLSNQQIISCYGRNGCKGGFVEKALDGAADDGVTLESIYPFEGHSGSCDRGLVNGLKSGQYLKMDNPSYTSVDRISEEDLMQAVAQAPVLIYFTATRDFMQYGGGVYKPSSCSGTVNHMLVVVGYSNTKNEWIIKNSWSEAWGEGGFARIKMSGGGKGPCNMYTRTFQPTKGFAKTFSNSQV